MAIDYCHACNTHTREGAQAGYRYVAAHVQGPIDSLVDVGCGTGPWIRAALNEGVADVLGVDGVIAPIHELAVAPEYIQTKDLTMPLDLGRRFSVALCLEVAEHLDEQHGPRLIRSLTNLSDSVVFSAACPNQPGQHHVNCQWPEFWQQLFNAQGFVCDDEIRWAMWTDSKVEPWYRQNIFIAKHAPDKAGQEPRLRPVLHPEMAIDTVMLNEHRQQQVRGIESGSMPLWWYFRTLPAAVAAKAWRHLGCRPRQAAAG